MNFKLPYLFLSFRTIPLDEQVVKNKLEKRVAGRTREFGIFYTSGDNFGFFWYHWPDDNILRTPQFEFQFQG